jgi:hypothetical protein
MKYFKVKNDSKIMEKNNFYFDNINQFKKETLNKMSQLLGVDVETLSKGGLASRGMLDYGVTKKIYDLIENKSIFKKNKTYIVNTAVYNFKISSKIYKEYISFCKNNENYEKLNYSHNDLEFWCLGKSSRACYKNLILLTADGEIEKGIMESIEEIKASEYYKLKEDKEDEIKKNKRS